MLKISIRRFIIHCQRLFIVIVTILCLINTVYAKTVTSENNRVSKTEFVSKDNRFKIIKECYAKDEWNSYCDYYRQTGAKRPQTIASGVKEFEDTVSWLQNTARIYLGGCGNPCKMDVFVDATHKPEFIENLIAVDHNNLCAAYPDSKGIIFKKLFSNKIDHIFAYKDYPSLESAANFAAVEGAVNYDGDMVLSYYSTDSGDGEDNEGEVTIAVKNPCGKKD